MSIEDARARMNAAHARWMQSKTGPNDWGRSDAIHAFADARRAFEKTQSAPTYSPETLAMSEHLKQYDLGDDAPASVTRSADAPTFDPLEL
jgi:hypothetical protein